VPAHHLKGVIVSDTPQSDDSNQVENPPSRLSLLLATPLRGCDLFHTITVLIAGTWRTVQTGHDGLVVMTRVEMVVFMIWGVVYASHSCETGLVRLTASQNVLAPGARDTPRNLARFFRSRFGPSHLEICVPF
jgi:hypothetical protein